MCTGSEMFIVLVEIGLARWTTGIADRPGVDFDDRISDGLGWPCDAEAELIHSRSVEA
jgi:hypothetical protein